MSTKMKTLCVAAALGTALTTGAPALAQQNAELRLGIVINVQTTLGGEFITTFADEVKAKSNGRVNIRVFDKGQLGGENEMLANVRLGDLDMALVNGAVLGSVEPAFSVTELPFVWRTREQAHRAIDGEIGADLRQRIEKRGIKVLAVGEWGYRQLLIKARPVSSVADLKGLKVRVAENPLYVSTWRSVGANPLPMSWTEVYTGLQQGLIDAVETNPIGMRDAKLQEVAKNLARTNHGFTSLVMIMNLDRWKALPPESQATLQAAAISGQSANRARALTANEEAIAEMEKAGVKVTTMNPAPFREAVQGVYQQFGKQVGQALVDKVIEAGK